MGGHHQTPNITGVPLLDLCHRIYPFRTNRSQVMNLLYQSRGDENTNAILLENVYMYTHGYIPTRSGGRPSVTTPTQASDDEINGNAIN